MKTSDDQPKTNDSPATDAQQFFKESPYHSLRGLECWFCDGVLTIKGNVPSFYLKQLAQTAAQRIEGVEKIENQVEVG